MFGSCMNFMQGGPQTFPMNQEVVPWSKKDEKFPPRNSLKLLRE